MNWISVKGLDIVGTASPEVRVSSAAASQDRPGQPAGPNLLVNAKRAGGETGCSAIGGATITEMDDAAGGAKVLRVATNGEALEQDVTELLQSGGPGNYRWSARVKAVEANAAVKATIILVSEDGIHHHPAPDAVIGEAGGAGTSDRVTPFSWGNLSSATLRIEPAGGFKGTFDLVEAVLCR